VLDKLVTRRTIAYQIRQGICFYVSCNAEFSKWNFMVDIKLFADVVFRYRAVLAFIIVPVSCVAALLMPIFSVIWFISTFPMAIILSCSFTGLAHPVVGAFLRTECSFFNLRWTPLKLFVAEQADNINAIILWMIGSVFSISFLINSKTSHCTKCFPKPVNSIWLALDKSPTYFARNFYKLSSCCISTLKRTIFLFGMTARGLKFNFTFKAWFGEYCSTGFIRAITRTKTNNPVGSFFNLRSTIFTRSHNTNIVII